MYVSYQLLINDLFLVGTLDPYSNGTWFNSAQIAKMFELFLFLFTYCLDNFRAEGEAVRLFFLNNPPR